MDTLRGTQKLTEEQAMAVEELKKYYMKTRTIHKLISLFRDMKEEMERKGYPSMGVTAIMMLDEIKRGARQ